ncbi:hypothetical protein FJTKL_04376 [Diaporthe vaccinii]|uniref:Rhodopsin domain-containing protein n=1 Tax=Diaporthe vaccinii TaxID=105482 RepID=A0ABR4F0W5_9PEZI
MYVRVREKVTSIDDYLLLGSLIFYIPDTAIAIHAATVGVGTVNARLNAWMQTQAMKWYTIWILIYVIGLALLKSSICTMIWRIASVRRGMRMTLIFLLSLVWASFFVTFIGVLLYCSPVEANWETHLVLEGKARCGSIAAMIGLSHTATVTTIITDIGCAMLPGVLLWKTQMKSQAKLEVFALMSVASITIARAPFISRYEKPEDDLKYYIGFIVLSSNIETGVGCVASCLPAMRRLYMRITKKETSENKRSNPQGTGSVIITIGGGGGGSSSRGRKQKGMFSSVADRSVNITTVQATGGARGGDWEQLHDGDSDEVPLSPWKKPAEGIRMDRGSAVELEPVQRGEARTD